MKDKLSRIHSPWRRLLITVLINTLVLFGIHRRPRARIHWLGRADRPRRHERLLLLVLLVAAGFVLEPRQYMLWAILWGGGAALFVNLCAIYYLLPRRKHHWVNSR